MKKRPNQVRERPPISPKVQGCNERSATMVKLEGKQQPVGFTQIAQEITSQIVKEREEVFEAKKRERINSFKVGLLEAAQIALKDNEIGTIICVISSNVTSISEPNIKNLALSKDNAVVGEDFISSLNAELKNEEQPHLEFIVRSIAIEKIELEVKLVYPGR